MKKTYLVIILLTVGNVLFAQTWDFANAIYGSAEDWIIETITDNDGYIYVSGVTYSDPINIGWSSHMNQGEKDIFLVKYDTNGDFIWVRFFGGSGMDYLKGLTIDNENNKLYAVGKYDSPIIDMGNIGEPMVLNNSSGNKKALLIKFDADNGDTEWVKDFGADGHCSFNDIELTNDYKPVIVGSFSGYNFYIETETIINTHPVGGAEDVFIIKFDPDGNLDWITSTSYSESDETCQAIEIDNNNNIFLGGQYHIAFSFGTIDFSTDIDNDGKLFILKLDQNGNALWGITAENEGYCSIYRALKCDGENIYAHFLWAGQNITFNGVTYTSPNTGDDREALFAKIDSNGNIIWVNELNGVQSVDLAGAGFVNIEVTQNNEAIICGAFYEPTMQFGDFNLVNPSIINGYAGYIVKYNQEGIPINAQVIGNDYFATAANIVLDNEENLIVSGYYLLGPITFGDYTLQSFDGTWDSFYAKLSDLPSSYVTTFNVTNNATPIENAEITIGTTTKLTNENGTVDFYFLPDSYSYSVIATGYDNIEDIAFSVTENQTINVEMEETVSVNDIEKQFAIYPNPSNGIFTIHNLQASNKPCHISITDITGKLVTSETNELIISNSQFTIHKKGIYFIKIKTENAIYTEKIIIK